MVVNFLFHFTVAFNFTTNPKKISQNFYYKLLTLISWSCTFFVLFSLLGLMLHARSRKKMLIIGGIFVFFSWLIYFLSMTAWLNLFLVVGHLKGLSQFTVGN